MKFKVLKLNENLFQIILSKGNFTEEDSFNTTFVMPNHNSHIELEVALNELAYHFDKRD